MTGAGRRGLKHEPHTGPVHIVHGGTYSHPEWLWIDVFPDRLRVTARRSETLLVGTGNIWAPTGPLANRQPRDGRGAWTACPAGL